tara:strand:+ start:14619 stop:16208 length:1590 start_codon:yes stop_codon:yes gene_type:complete
MPAVVTDQFRIVNAGNFVDSVLDSNNSYYVFLGLPNPSSSGFGRTTTQNPSWPYDPTDNQQYLTHYRDTSLFGKKLNSSNIRRVVKKHNWVSNTRYDIYRHDYNEQTNQAPNSKTGSLYKTNYYVITSEFKVYICLSNGGSGDPNSTDAKGVESLDEPTFTDLEPAAAGTQDPYVWKYLFTVSPSDVVKFDSTEYIVLPNDWSTSTDSQIQAVREAGDSDINKNQIRQVYIENSGAEYGPDNTYPCDILGDGSGAKVNVTVVGGKITETLVTSGGSGYTFGMVDLSDLDNNVTTRAKLIPIIPPSKGHGFDIYTELGADKVLVYSRFDDSTKDFPTDTHFGQVGILKNPLDSSNSGILTTSQFSSLFAAKLNTDPGLTPESAYDNLIGVSIGQTTSSGNLAKGIVASYDRDTRVLKYIQDRSSHLNQTTNDNTDYNGVENSAKVLSFESGQDIFAIPGGSVSFSSNIENFTGISTTVNNKLVNLGVQFTNGLANPEINKKTGNVIYIDNRKEVERNIRQKEDVKIILEF